MKVLVGMKKPGENTPPICVGLCTPWNGTCVTLSITWCPTQASYCTNTKPGMVQTDIPQIPNLE